MFFDLVRATLKDKSEMCIHVAGGRDKYNKPEE